MLPYDGRPGMPRSFAPITILPFTKAQRKQLVALAQDAAGAYAFPFNLSAEPPPEWARLFLLAWYRDRGGACLPRFGGTVLHVTSAVEDLQNTLSALKLIVDETNRKHLDALRRQAEEEAAANDRAGGAKRSAAQAMADALDRLKF